MARRFGAIALATCVLGGGVAHAQQPRPTCVPGTPFCAATDANGGVHVQGNVSPNGASATGNANGNGWGNLPMPPPPAYAPPKRSGRFGFGVGGCPAVRVGLWSGVKGGACVAISFRFESISFEMETQLLYGGTTNAFDWTFPMSFLVPLGNQRSLFDGAYLRFGGSPVGATFAKTEDGGGFVRFAVFAGAGYELSLGSAVTWRVFDARATFDLGTRRAMDRLGHFIDPGLQLSTGLVF